MSNIAANRKVIAISGGSRGIGLAIAKRFAEEGWEVAIAARSEAALHKIQEEWESDYPDSSLLVFAADLSDAAGCQAWGAYLLKHCPQLDALVHNLGTFAPGTLLNGPPEQLESFFAINVLSAHYLTRACFPLLQKARRANMVTIGSVATTDWPSDLAAYALSKHALEAWHRQLRKELAGGHIRTTLLRPGATFTSSWEGVDIDPALLLSAERVAALAARVILLPEDEEVEEIYLRPRNLLEEA